MSSAERRVEPDGIQATSVYGTRREHYFTRSTVFRVIDEEIRAALAHPVLTPSSVQWVVHGLQQMRERFGACPKCGSTAEGAEGCGTHCCEPSESHNDDDWTVGPVLEPTHRLQTVPNGTIDRIEKLEQRVASMGELLNEVAIASLQHAAALRGGNPTPSLAEIGEVMNAMTSEEALGAVKARRHPFATKMPLPDDVRERIAELEAEVQQVREKLVSRLRVEVSRQRALCLDASDRPSAFQVLRNLDHALDLLATPEPTP